MTRKTPKKKQRRNSKKRRFKVTVEGQPMLVDYSPNWMHDTGMFEFRSPHKPVRRIPVSETGYRSHFASMEDIEDAENPQAYARLYALSVIRRVPVTALKTAEASQPSLPNLLD